MDKTIELLKQALARFEAMKADFAQASQLFKQGAALLDKHLADNEVPSGIDLSKLSSRELEIIKLLGQKVNEKDIGNKLGIKEKSVRRHKDRMRGKLNIENGYELDLLAEQIYSQTGKIELTK